MDLGFDNLKWLFYFVACFWYELLRKKWLINHFCCFCWEWVVCNHLLHCCWGPIELIDAFGSSYIYKTMDVKSVNVLILGSIKDGTCQKFHHNLLLRKRNANSQCVTLSLRLSPIVIYIYIYKHFLKYAHYQCKNNCVMF